MNLRWEFEDDLHCRREADWDRLQLGQEQQQGTGENTSNSGSGVTGKLHQNVYYISQQNHKKEEYCTCGRPEARASRAGKSTNWGKGMIRYFVKNLPLTGEGIISIFGLVVKLDVGISKAIARKYRLVGKTFHKLIAESFWVNRRKQRKKDPCLA